MLKYKFCLMKYIKNFESINDEKGRFDEMSDMEDYLIDIEDNGMGVVVDPDEDNFNIGYFYIDFKDDDNTIDNIKLIMDSCNKE
jgi:hypothetical protein